MICFTSLGRKKHLWNWMMIEISTWEPILPPVLIHLRNIRAWLHCGGQPSMEASKSCHLHSISSTSHQSINQQPFVTKFWRFITITVISSILPLPKDISTSFLQDSTELLLSFKITFTASCSFTCNIPTKYNWSCPELVSSFWGGQNTYVHMYRDIPYPIGHQMPLSGTGNLKLMEPFWSQVQKLSILSDAGLQLL